MVGENNKVVIVTGGSSGIGRCTASALKENGCIVYEFSRRNIPMEGVTHLSVDVTDEDAVNAAVQQVIQKETKIDAVVNCAGFGISGAVEFTSMEQAKAQFDVNFFGTVTVNKAVLPFLRRQGKGHIVNISSVAAVAHIPFQTFYSASKAAVSSYSYALANEVKPYGIHVTVVELGDICTGFTKARQKSILGDDEYGGRISRSVSQMEHDEQNGMDPARIGRYIAGIVEKKKPAVVYVAGAQYKFLSLLCKLLPAAARGKIPTGKLLGDFFNVSVFSRWCSFPLQKNVLHFSVPEPVPASRSAPCGSPGIVLILVNLPTKNSPPGRHGQEGCFSR